MSPALPFLAAFCCLAAALVIISVRLIRGPTLADRILALDTMTVLGVAIIAAFAAYTGFYLYTDIAIALALVGFLSTVAFARYLLSRSGK
jgi:multicomponent Na+:H+ antiporter subunit F